MPRAENRKMKSSVGINTKGKKMRKHLPQKRKHIFVLLCLVIAGTLLIGCGGKEEPKSLEHIAINTWIDTLKKAEADEKPHNVTYRVTEIVRDPNQVAEAITEFNQRATGTIIAPLENDKLEFCLMTYQVKFPKDFPQSGFGITEVSIPFEVVSLFGREIQVEDIIYKNLRATWEIGERPQGYDFYAGSTYDGSIVFIMVKGYSDYLIHEVKESTAESDQIYIKGE